MQKTADCKLLFAWCLVFVIDCPSYPPPPHPFRYDFLLLPWLLFWLFSKVQRFDTKVWKTKFDCPGSTENTISMICWSCVLETDFDTHTHTHTHHFHLNVRLQDMKVFSTVTFQGLDKTLKKFKKRRGLDLMRFILFGWWFFFPPMNEKYAG